MLAGAEAVVGIGLVLVVLGGSPAWAALRIAVVVLLVGLLAGIVRSESGRAAGWAAILSGGIAVAVGAAIAVPWTAAGVVAARSVGAWLTLVAGLVLLVGGLVLLWRSLAGWRRLVPALAVLVLAYPVLYPVVIAVVATNVPRHEIGDRTPADLDLAYRSVTFPASDGVELSGWYVPSRNGAAVAVLHGASSTRSAVLAQAAVLAEGGYGVLLYDARGGGRSGGRGMNLGWYGDRDVAGAVAFLAARPDVDPARIGALGESMGAEQAIGALPRVPGLQAVVAEGATGRVAGDRTWLSDRYGVRGSVQEVLERETTALTSVLTEVDPPATLRSALARSGRRPVLLIAAGEVEEEQAAARFLRAAAPGSVQVWVVPGSGHTGGLATAPTAWRDRVLRFFDAALAPSG